MEDFKSYSKYKLASAAVSRKTKGTQRSPMCYRGRVASSSRVRNLVCLLSQTPILEPSRISGLASGRSCAAEVISVLLWALSLAQENFLLSERNRSKLLHGFGRVGELFLLNR